MWEELTFPLTCLIASHCYLVLFVSLEFPPVFLTAETSAVFLKKGHASLGIHTPLGPQVCPWQHLESKMLCS